MAVIDYKIVYRAVNHSKSLSGSSVEGEGKCEERGIQSVWRGGKEVGRDDWERNGKRNCGRVGRDQGRKGKGGRNDREERTPSHNVHVVEGLCPYVRCFLPVHTAGRSL